VKVTVDRLELKKAISIAKSYLPAKPLIEVDGELLMTLKDGKFSVSATDNQQACFIDIDVLEFEGEGKFSCDPKRVDKALTKSSCLSVELDYDPVEYTLELVLGKDTSVISFKTFPTDKMSNFKPNIEGCHYRAAVNTKILYTGIKYLQAFTPYKNDVSKKYDFAIIGGGIMYSANGVNKRGYFISRELAEIKDTKIQKKFMETLGKSLFILDCEKVVVIERDSVTTIESEDGKFISHMLKSRSVPPDMPKQYIQVKGDPYTTVNREKLIKSIDRSTSASYSKVGTPIGLQLTVSGSGEESTLKTDMITNALKTIDSVECIRHDDGDGEVSNLLDYKLFKTILSSFSKEGETRLYINQPDLKYFKIYAKGEIEGIPFAEVGVGAYSRRVR